jgi:hypothetical protein
MFVRKIELGVLEIIFYNNKILSFLLLKLFKDLQLLLNKVKISVSLVHSNSTSALGFPHTMVILGSWSLSHDKFLLENFCATLNASCLVQLYGWVNLTVQISYTNFILTYDFQRNHF